MRTCAEWIRRATSRATVVLPTPGRPPMSTSTPLSSSPPELVAEQVSTARLELEPLRISHAAEAARAFADERLHTFTGGSPADEAALRDRYARQLRGHSPDGLATWLNWMVRRRDTRELVGTVQATVTAE